LDDFCACALHVRRGIATHGSRRRDADRKRCIRIEAPQRLDVRRIARLCATMMRKAPTGIAAM
jgi:hypothetical protein